MLDEPQTNTAAADDLFERINRTNHKLSKGQQAIADFLVKHYDKAAFMTASKLSKTVGVSESTVVRFAIAIGYEGYPDMRRTFGEMIKNRLTAMQRIDIAEDAGGTDLVMTVLKADANNIRATMENMDIQSLEAAIDSIVSARNIYVLGMRSSAPLAQFMGYYLNYVSPNVTTVTGGVADAVEQISRIEPCDLLIAIGFPRYSNRTLEAMAFAKKSGARILGITDSKQSPITKGADVSVIARCQMVSFVDSMATPLSVINALVVAVAHRCKAHVSETFERLERLWQDYNVYAPKDIV